MFIIECAHVNNVCVRMHSTTHMWHLEDSFVEAVYFSSLCGYRKLNSDTRIAHHHIHIQFCLLRMPHSCLAFSNCVEKLIGKLQFPPRISLLSFVIVKFPENACCIHFGEVSMRKLWGHRKQTWEVDVPDLYFCECILTKRTTSWFQCI